MTDINQLLSDLFRVEDEFSLIDVGLWLWENNLWL